MHLHGANIAASEGPRVLAGATGQPAATRLDHDSVLVAMSGGVDSSVAALLLQEAGFECRGVILELLGNAPEDASRNCHGPASEAGSASQPGRDDATPTLAATRAQEAAGKLGVPLFEEECPALFETQVIRPFCNAYLAGLTPNPCILCNKALKFGFLHQLREELGLGYLATGHYARVQHNPRTNRYELLRGLDGAKDQSYVLYHLSQEQLACTLFPLGGLTKKEVRHHAAEAGFANAAAPESQDICFIPDGDYRAFLERRLRNTKIANEGALPDSPIRPGPIILKDGTAVGTHQGLPFYTIGQRKGLGVAYREPLFVLRKDTQANTLVVGPKSTQAIQRIRAYGVNFVSIPPWEGPLKALVKTSYRQKAVPATARIIVAPDDGHRSGCASAAEMALSPGSASGPLLEIAFAEPIVAAACGQVAVLYDYESNSKVLAGGIICATE